MMKSKFISVCLCFLLYANYSLAWKGEGKHHFRPPHPPPHHEAPVDQWLQTIGEENPQLFKRLKNMRQENPHEFRRTLRRQLREQRFLKAIQTNTNLFKCYMNLSQPEQARIVREIYHDEHRPPPRMGGKSKHKFKKLDHEIHNLGKQYQDATESEREAIEKVIKGKLKYMMELRSNNRKEFIDQLKQQLADLEKKQIVRKENIDAIVERRFQEITNDQDLE